MAKMQYNAIVFLTSGKTLKYHRITIKQKFENYLKWRYSVKYINYYDTRTRQFVERVKIG
ncbi:MAG: hypothetical protein IT249_09430 [Chitinophagaceae bacterium]|nr:hypothetical protein [Chitinophagaceae bacterium]